MGKLGTIARRTFLIGSAAIAGGVAFGVYAYKRDPDNPLLNDLADGEAAITPYVKITSDGITLITPRSDVGQGAYSMQAALIAEELDVSLDQVRVDPGPAAKAYYNTALSQEAAPFRPYDDGLAAQSTRTVLDAMMKFLGMHITGGSTSVPDSYDKLREAGAVARETLKRAAADQTGETVAKLTTENGAVVLPNGDRIAYTALAETAARTEPVTDVSLRDPATWRFIGKPMERLDIRDKSTGKQVYGIDRVVEGMVHATVRTNPRNGGALKSYDASAAEKMRGVKKVVPITGGVAVVADNTWRAFKAADAISFQWGEAPFPPGMDAHWKAVSDSFVDGRQDSRMRDEGDVDAALSEKVDLETEYRAPYLAHAPLEPINAIVKVTDDRADVWTGTQIPRFVAMNVARLTGLDQDQVHVHVQMMGGSFGHRLEDTVVRQATEIAMTMKGTPVKLTYTREEDVTHDYARQIAMGRARARVDQGQVRALDLGIAMPSVVESQMGRQGLSLPGPDLQIVAGAWEQPYDIPDYRVTGYRSPQLAPISSWRSVGASTNAFFHESALDEAIHAAGADPMVERIRLCTHEPSRKVLEAVRDLSGWDGARMGDKRGRGVAFCMSFGVPCAEVVEVTDTTDGIRIDKVFVAVDVGRVVDPVNLENQVEGGVVFGLGHAMNAQITYADGIAEQKNFDAFVGMRLHQCPQITVKALENSDKIRGVGEPPVPPAAPALANAIFAATGKRLRSMPFDSEVSFV